MSDTVSAIPEGIPRIAPLLTVRDADAAIDYYRAVFGAEEVLRLTAPDGRVLHGELQIGGAMVMLVDEFPEWENRNPESIGGTPVRIHLYVEDVDAVAGRAVDAGGMVAVPVAVQFYGDRSGRIEDPYGHQWVLASHVEDVSAEEMQRRSDQLFG